MPTLSGSIWSIIPKETDPVTNISLSFRPSTPGYPVKKATITGDRYSVELEVTYPPVHDPKKEWHYTVQPESDQYTYEPFKLRVSSSTNHINLRSPVPSYKKTFIENEKPLRLSALPGRLNNQNSVNATAFTQDNVTTDGNTQYAVWSNHQRKPIIGRRTLPSGRWETFDLSTITGNPLSSPTEENGHNNYVVAVDSSGYIHVTGNHHNDPLRYVRSARAGDITSWVSPGMVGDESGITYPQFVRAKDDELLFVYRTGSSGNGDMFINAYNHTTQTWSRRTYLFYGADGVDPESAYINHVAVSSDGTLHLWFVWRLTPNLGDTWNVCYVKSTNNGQTFTNISGGALTLPITYETSPVVKAGDIDLLNQSGADVDSLGRPHAVWWVATPTNTTLVHFWHDGTNWREDTEFSFGYYVPLLDLARPAVVCYDTYTFAILSQDRTPNRRKNWLVKDITPSPAIRLPEFPLYVGDLGDYEPSYDTRSVRSRGELHMLITPIAPGGASMTSTNLPEYAAIWGSVLTLDLNRISEVAYEKSIKEPVFSETLFITPSMFSSTFGTPDNNGTVAGTPMLRFDAAALEVSAAVVNIPSSWRTFHIDAWWTNAGAGSGNVVWQVRHSQRADTNNMSSGEITIPYVTSAAPAQNVITVTRVASDLVRLPNNLFRISYRRNGADAADTLGNDSGFFGFMLIRSS